MPDATQTGLSENSASAIAYITFIPAIVFLATPPYNQSPVTRFHSWQSIFLCIAWFAVWFVLMLVRIVTPGFFFFHLLMSFLGFACWLGFFVIWLICLINAVNGKRFTLPILGPLAAKQAGI
jgi:uncharacterized membrane protein